VIPLVLQVLCNLIDEESVAVLPYRAYVYFFAIIQEDRFKICAAVRKLLDSAEFSPNEIAVMCEEAHTWAIASGGITAATKGCECRQSCKWREEYRVKSAPLEIDIDGFVTELIKQRNSMLSTSINSWNFEVAFPGNEFAVPCFAAGRRGYERR
jgi:hypothetical protein